MDLPRSRTRLWSGLRNISLTRKALVIASLLSLLAGLALDQAHQRHFQQWLDDDLYAHDRALANEMAHRFKVSLETYLQLTALVTEQRLLLESITGQPDSHSGDRGDPQSWRPAWLPETIQTHAFPPVSGAFLLNRDGQTRESFHGDPLLPVAAFERWIQQHLLWQPKRAGVVMFNGQALVFASHPVRGSNGHPIGTLVLVSVLNENYLQYLQVTEDSDLLTGIMLGNEARLVSSSAPQSLPPGRLITTELNGLDSLGRYPIETSYGGQNLFLVIYRQHSATNGVLDTLLHLDRQHQVMTMLVFFAMLGMFSVWVSGRIRRLNQQVTEFSQRLGMALPIAKGGDELCVLEKRFQRFSEEIIAETSVLEYQSLHDPLTGLPNRMLLQDRLEYAIAQSLREQNSMAFLLMDLDRFKEINDTLGHHIGDRLLQEAAKRISEVLRKSDTVARLGGDEFAVLLPSTKMRSAKTVCSKIIEAIEKPFTIDTLCLRVGVSIGMAMCPEFGEDATTLLQRADVAMYNAKRGGLGYAIYTPEQDEHSVSRLGLVGELKDAVDKNQLELCYQPMVDMRTGKIHTAEALVRWNHPTQGQIAPDEFIPLAEQSGVIRDLTMWVFHNAMLQWSQWHHVGIELHLSLNLSVRVLQDKELPGKVQRLIDHHGIDPSWITLEVTESAIMSDPVTARRVLRRLADMGLKLSIDDFGTGYSSLSYLKQLPVNAVKIDKSFVSQMDQNENDAVIVRATIDLAHNLGLKVVAEGVETEDVWDLLEMLGCDVAQGFLIRRPISPGELARWIASQRWKAEHWATHRLAQVSA